MNTRRSVRRWLVLALLVGVAAGCSGSKDGDGGGGGGSPGGGPDKGPSAPAKGSLRSKGAVLFIIAPKDFRREELETPKAILEKAGCEVVVASSKLGLVTGTPECQAEAALPLWEVKADDYDVVVFVGGPGAAAYFDDATAHKIAKDAAAKGKILGAICIAPSILARAGVLKGKTATAYPDDVQKKDINDNGGTWSDKAVVRDGKIVTANGPDAAEEFGRTLAAALAEAMEKQRP